MSTSKVFNHVLGAPATLQGADLSPFIKFAVERLHFYRSGREQNHQINSLSDFRGEKLLIIFYSQEWKTEGTRFIDEALRDAKRGQNLLIVTADRISSLDIQASLSGEYYLYSDPQNLIAEKFGAWDPKNPVWARISGINGDIPYPATFEINRDGYITNGYIERFEHHLADILRKSA